MRTTYFSVLALLGILGLLGGATCGPAPNPCELSPDQDGDGTDSSACGGEDCDDADATRHPGNNEVCDAADHDEDCNPYTFGDRDVDGDGHIDVACGNVDASGMRINGADCDDTRAFVNPGMPEICDGLDDDCDGVIDEGAQLTMVVDADGDGHGDAAVGAETIEGCALRPGYSFVADDCDDLRSDVHPAAAELCDGIDNNCHGNIDEGALLTFYVDEDDDGFGTAETLEACASGPGRATLPGDCDDTNAALVNGSMRCVDTLQYQVCQDGAWSIAAGCSTQQCAAQPNGTGTCR
jgi:hypothetical protein